MRHFGLSLVAMKPLHLCFLCLIIITSGCNQIQKAADVVTKPSAREVYAREFSKEDSLFISWNQTFDIALQDSLQITLPYSESGVFTSEKQLVHSYNVQLVEGQRLFVETTTSPDSLRVFIDLFQTVNDSIKELKLLKSSEPDSQELIHEIEEYTTYKITVQPEIRVSGSYILKIYTMPVYQFPVSGVDNSSIQSVWGDSREGGKRFHEGVDIFAERGTPVVAVTDGRISSVGERGKGGKQVWLRDGLFGKSLYYAHLDSIVATNGLRVKTGDTLGFVGNSGNAVTTKPHLHFGIYKGYTGAVNPLPYIKMTEIPEVDSPFNESKGTVLKNKSELRSGPATGFEQLASLPKNDTVFILGKHQNWYHISTTTAIKGFIYTSLLSPVPSN